MGVNAGAGQGKPGQVGAQPSENWRYSAARRASGKRGTKCTCRIWEKPSLSAGATNLLLGERRGSVL